MILWKKAADEHAEGHESLGIHTNSNNNLQVLQPIARRVSTWVYILRRNNHPTVNKAHRKRTQSYLPVSTYHSSQTLLPSQAFQPPKLPQGISNPQSYLRAYDSLGPLQHYRAQASGYHCSWDLGSGWLLGYLTIYRKHKLTRHVISLLRHPTLCHVVLMKCYALIVLLLEAQDDIM